MGTVRTFIGNIKGNPGNTPYVGANDNWWIGELDTGVKAEGADGKSAYEYAKDGGFTGTEAEFSKKLNETANAYTQEESDALTQAALNDAKQYTDNEISELINGAPTTLDTLGEIATAMAENADVVTALNNAIGSKAASADLAAHINNKSNPHSVTAAQIGLSTENWTFTLEDGSTVTKAVYVG